MRADDGAGTVREAATLFDGVELGAETVRTHGESSGANIELDLPTTPACVQQHHELPPGSAAPHQGILLVELDGVTVRVDPSHYGRSS